MPNVGQWVLFTYLVKKLNASDDEPKKATFPSAIINTLQGKRLIVSEKLADHMKDHGINDFWKDIRKHNKSKSALSNCID